MRRSLVLYVIGQAIGYGIDFGTFIFTLAVAPSVTPLLANIIAKTLAATFAFVFHGHFTFPGDKARGNKVTVPIYVSVVIGNMALTSLLITILLHIGVPPYVAKFSADVVGVGFTYLALRTLVFARRGADS